MVVRSQDAINWERGARAREMLARHTPAHIPRDDAITERQHSAGLCATGDLPWLASGPSEICRGPSVSGVINGAIASSFHMITEDPLCLLAPVG